jgi:predicted glutamine amidotransferase
MMATIGTGPVPESWLLAFRCLADCGRIVPGWKPGHGDGWGIGVVAGGRARLVGKGDRSPLVTPDAFRAAAGAARRARPGSLIFHLRKSSVGRRSEANSHPFLAANALFCHNGTIRNKAAIPLPAGVRPGGETDSERFFLFLAGLAAGRGRAASPARWEAAARRAVAFARARLRYTSLTFLLASPGMLLAYRECHSSESEREYPPGELEKYYTLYTAEAGGRVIAASEPVAAVAGPWRPMENRELRVYGARGKRSAKL